MSAALPFRCRLLPFENGIRCPLLASSGGGGGGVAITGGKNENFLLLAPRSLDDADGRTDGRTDGGSRAASSDSICPPAAGGLTAIDDGRGERGGGNGDRIAASNERTKVLLQGKEKEREWNGPTICSAVWARNAAAHSICGRPGGKSENENSK